MAMTKYGTFVMYQNIETDEVVEVALADEETLNKYANDRNWREVGAQSEPTNDTDKTDEDSEKE